MGGCVGSEVDEEFGLDPEVLYTQLFSSRNEYNEKDEAHEKRMRIMRFRMLHPELVSSRKEYKKKDEVHEISHHDSLTRPG